MKSLKQHPRSMNIKIRNRIFTIAALLAISMGLSACGDSTGTNDQTPPDLPPQESMSTDMSTFDQGPQKQNLNTQQAGFENFTRAAFEAAAFKVILNANLFIPRAIFKAATKVDPEGGNNGEWNWNYSVDTNDKVFKASLTGQKDKDAGRSTWQMHITNNQTEPALDNFLLFEGQAQLDGTSGYWIYYDWTQPDQQTKISRLDWSNKSENALDLTLKVLSNRNNNINDVIEYQVSDSTKTVTYTDASKSSEIKIHWNSETHAGYLIDPDYNNGNKACWDSNFQNVACTTN